MIRAPLITVAGVTAFVVPAFFIDADTMNETLSAGLLIAAAFGVVRWGAAAWRVYWRGAVEERDWGILAIVGLLISLAAQRVLAVITINLDRPVWLRELHLSPFLTYSLLVCCVLLIAATRFDGEKPSRMDNVTAGLIAFLGVLMSAAGPYIISKLSALSSVLSRMF